MNHNTNNGFWKVNRIRSFLKSTKGYVFLHTVVPQVFCLFTNLTTWIWAWWGSQYDWLALIGVVGLIDVWMLMACVSTFICSYGEPLFAIKNTNKLADYENSTKRYRIKHYANGDVTIREMPESGIGLPLLAMLFNCLVVMLFGTVQFVIELVRIKHSENRRMVWESDKENLLSKIHADPKGFFNFLIKGSIIFIAVWVIMLIGYALYNL